MTYAVHPEAAGQDANVIKPLYHIAWLASRLGMTVAQPLDLVPVAAPEPDAANGGRDVADRPDEALEAARTGQLRAGRRLVNIAIRPTASAMYPGTTLTVQLTARRRGMPLEVVVSAEAEAVIVRATLDGRPLPERRFMAPRRGEVDLLVESVESVGPDPVAVAALVTAAELVGEA